MKAFFDTNILIYAVEASDKGVACRRPLDKGGCIGVQCLNEFANVAINKLKFDWAIVDRLLERTRSELGPAIPVDERIHVNGCRISRRYGLSIYDSMIVAAAIEAGCDTLYSEDMHVGLVINGSLTIVNPFV